MAFKKAERKKVKLKLALTGPSGGGKTFSALALASGIGSKIALLDTENESASLYADRFNFETEVISPPYTIAKYIKAINDAVNGGFDVLVIDSLSHAWAGSGGLLDKKAAKDASGKGNSYTNWNGLTQEQEQFISTILNAKIHLICTMRSKQEYVLVENEKGKQQPKKIGMAPIQRDGVEYEFTTVFDLDMNHQAQASKDRTGLWMGEIFQITEDTGKRFVEWLKGGADAPVEPAVEPFDAQPVSILPNAQLLKLAALAKEKNWTNDQVSSYMRMAWNIESSKTLDQEGYDLLIQVIKEGSYTQAIKAVMAGGADEGSAS